MEVNFATSIRLGFQEPHEETYRRPHNRNAKVPRKDVRQIQDRAVNLKRAGPDQACE